jgi:hypothetical protein
VRTNVDRTRKKKKLKKKYKEKKKKKKEGKECGSPLWAPRCPSPSSQI